MEVERDIDALFKKCEDLENEVYNLNFNIVPVFKEEIEDLKALVTSLLTTSTSRYIELKDLMHSYLYLFSVLVSLLNKPD